MNAPSSAPSLLAAETFTVGSLFSGVGGLDLAAHWAGFETKWFVEKEPFCQKILAKHWPNTPIHSDVFECRNLEHVSILIGGFPCQPFSVAGNRKGADDERYLLPEMLRIIREVKPYAVLFENVPGFPSLSDGAEFKYLLRALAEMGFNAEWGHLRASDSGAPHQRERWFLVAYSKSGHDARDTRTMGYSQTQTGKQDVRQVIGGSGSNVADATREQRYGSNHHARKFMVRQSLSEFGNHSGAKLMVNASSTGCQKRNLAAIAVRARHITRRLNATGRSGQSQPRLRRTLNGLPGWLDFVGWPARPGEDQYAYEPSRVTSAKTPDRAARLKALGNAVVPQVAYPLFAAIHEWLTAQVAERVA